MSLDLIDLMLEAGAIVQLVLVLLAVMSVVSWAIIAQKWRELVGAAKDSEAFLDVYHAKSLEDCYEAARGLRRGPSAVIFLAARSELARQAQRGSAERGGAERGALAVRARLAWAAAKEMARLERGLSFLATTGSSAPFIGLFGTVIGIIQAFQNIARSGNASLAVVAPGIAEALIATAVGLLAAIPATIFYNLFVGRVDAINAEVELFSSELEEDLSSGVQVMTRPAPAQSEG